MDAQKNKRAEYLESTYDLSSSKPFPFPVWVTLGLLKIAEGGTASSSQALQKLPADRARDTCAPT